MSPLLKLTQGTEGGGEDTTRTGRARSCIVQTHEARGPTLRPRGCRWQQMRRRPQEVDGGTAGGLEALVLGGQSFLLMIVDLPRDAHMHGVPTTRLL